ncbi:hypothetical protein [Yinghuangia seranimata]|uniref:hypothetical protein n=1 Tax=Yinghuangia seranimata TaxID=408067 RepID=UPI00248D1D02|nr:hypothetical protein [Yinghuangia seranimata]MDI2132065.1 hypothetical protein [Yinghuangia seranimata]
MAARDALESVIRAWHRLEVEREGTGVIEFDCAPDAALAGPDVSVTDRMHVYKLLSDLAEDVEATGEPYLRARLRADLAYLGARLGERPELDAYMRATQGCAAAGWPAEYVEDRRDAARADLDKLGIGWNAATDDMLRALEGPLESAAAPDAIRAAAAELEPAVRALVGTDAPYELTVESTDVDAYWSYWLDGAGQRVRLRINPRNARFTRVSARQFALHEVLGHGLQCAAFANRCATDDVPWVRLLSVHGPTGVLLEGLAQTLPLFAAPDDDLLAVRVRLDHYQQLVRAELHLAVNSGVPIAACAAHARARVPFWSDRHIADLLADRGTDPRLRSYLWAYPAGFDWFVRLADADATVIAEVLHAAYRDPLTPEGLSGLWPDGPPVGGPGSPVRLREPDVPGGAPGAA